MPAALSTHSFLGSSSPPFLPTSPFSLPYQLLFLNNAGTATSKEGGLPGGMPPPFRFLRNLSFKSRRLAITVDGTYLSLFLFFSEVSPSSPIQDCELCPGRRPDAVGECPPPHSSGKTFFSPPRASIRAKPFSRARILRLPLTTTTIESVPLFSLL